MGRSAQYAEICGIKTIQSNDSKWPAPATLFVIEDDHGLNIIDVGCGGITGPDHLVGGLVYWGFSPQSIHTVVLSHAHPDHMGALSWLLNEIQPRILIHRLDLPSLLEPNNLVYTFDIPLAQSKWTEAHGASAFSNFDLLQYFKQTGCAMSSASQAETIQEGDIVTLGDFAFEVLHTPGHSPGHISLFDKDTGILFSGDLVGQSPTWYTPTSGGTIDYLRSLEKMETLHPTILLPSHGTVIHEPKIAISRVRKKLLQKEQHILDALAKRPRSFMELNRAVFQGQLMEFFPGIAMTESHLNRLEQTGSIRCNHDGTIELS